MKDHKKKERKEENEGFEINNFSNDDDDATSKMINCFCNLIQNNLPTLSFVFVIPLCRVIETFNASVSQSIVNRAVNLIFNMLFIY